MSQSTFVYTNYVLDSTRTNLQCNFELRLDHETITLSEKYVFPEPLDQSRASEKLFEMLHIISGISYYKIFVSQAIIHPYQMSTAQAEFWNWVFANGLSEFLYTNHLNPSILAKFNGLGIAEPASSIGLKSCALLGVGGGKDSIVAGELLRSLGLDFRGFVLAASDANGQTQAVAKVMGTSLDVVRRTIDPQLLDLQERPGATKGHVPISMFFGIIGCLLATSRGCSYVIVANESSSSLPRHNNTSFAVNHQWSKSFEFETEFANYIHEFVATDLTYFSAIRPLSSVGVSKLFAKLPQYFEVFSSDNYSMRMNAHDRPETRWSLQSPKTLSSYILLSAWLSEDTLSIIFGIEPMNEPSLVGLFKQLVGLEGEPPLDCVGTVDELRASLDQALSQGKFMNAELIKLSEYQPDPKATNMAKHLELFGDSGFPTAINDDLNQLIEARLMS